MQILVGNPSRDSKEIRPVQMMSPTWNSLVVSKLLSDVTLIWLLAHK